LYQSMYSVTDSPLSRASPLPHLAYAPSSLAREFLLIS
jgi:hypothetical protein